MNNAEKTKTPIYKRLFQKEKLRDIFIIAALALVLIIAVWKIFYKEEQSVSTSSLSENEQKVSRLLEEIEGVGEAEVMICETEEGVQSVVVVCEGARNFQVVIDVREAVAAALGTSPKSVKVYLKKE